MNAQDLILTLVCKEVKHARMWVTSLHLLRKAYAEGWGLPPTQLAVPAAWPRWPSWWRHGWPPRVCKTASGGSGAARRAREEEPSQPP